MWQIFTALSATAIADSPLTSVDWSSSYGDLSPVLDARSQGVGVVLPEIVSDRPADERLAVVSALGWGKPEVPLAIASALARKRGVPVESLTLERLSAADRAVLAYAVALADYADMAPIRDGAPGVLGLDPMQISSAAVALRPDSFAIAALDALLSAQASSGSRCGSVRAWEALLVRFPEAERDARPGVVAAGSEYLRTFAAACPK